VPLVEKTDLIDNLTEWVLRQALDDLRGLGFHAAHMTMAVNVSVHNLRRPGFADLVERSLRRAHISANRLVIEVSETALLSDLEGARGALSRLDALAST